MGLSFSRMLSAARPRGVDWGLDEAADRQLRLEEAEQRYADLQEQHLAILDKVNAYTRQMETIGSFDLGVAADYLAGFVPDLARLEAEMSRADDQMREYGG